MSIHAMIAAHPDVVGKLDEPLATAVRHAMFCSAMCTSCRDAGVVEQMDMRQCIRLCLDCADICDATMRVATRQTGSNPDVVRAMLGVCVDTCRACAEECARHDNAHCRLCAQMSHECADDCEEATGPVPAHGA